MAGRLKEPKTITDYNQALICILPVGFYFDDDRWDRIWQRYEEKGQPLTSIDLYEMFPEEGVLKKMVMDTQAQGETIPDGIKRAIAIRS
ncbi:MAG: hypothetical protein EP297_03645 [Gammaproteobacteria bacterium]|nr:MAG: hypothetical protein EP297_03645 [Gammaproteobacteria bacterium]